MVFIGRQFEVSFMAGVKTSYPYFCFGARAPNNLLEYPAPRPGMKGLTNWCLLTSDTDVKKQVRNERNQLVRHFGDYQVKSEAK